MPKELEQKISWERERWKYRRRMTIAVMLAIFGCHVWLIGWGDPASGIHNGAQELGGWIAVTTLLAYFGGSGVTDIAANFGAKK